MWTKEAFLGHVEQTWYLKDYASKIASWAIGEEEQVLEDYLAKEEQDQEGNPVKEHYVVTDRRVLHFKLTRRKIEYRTVFVSDDIASINQRFSVPNNLLDNEQMRAPNVEVVLKNGASMTFEAPPYSEDKERFKRFVLAIVSLFPARKS